MIASAPDVQNASFLDLMERELSGDKASARTFAEFHNRFDSEILEWAVIFCPQIWESPPSHYHADVLNRFKQAALMIDAGGNPLPRDRVWLWAVSVPRHFIKTTLMQVGMLWFMLEAPRSGRFDPSKYTTDHLRYITGTESLAAEKLAWVWEQLRGNPRILSVYGDQLRGQKCTETEARLRNGIWIKGGGFKSRHRGGHPYMMVPDDVEDREDVDSDTGREGAVSLWNRTISGMMGPGRPTFMVGNFIHPLSLFKKIWQIHAETSVAYKALNRDEKGEYFSLWPEKFPVDWLKDKRREIGTEAFETEWQNNPTVSSKSPVRAEWIQWYDSANKAYFKPGWWKKLKIVTWLDPAITENEASDYSAIVTVGCTMPTDGTDPIFLVLDARRGKWGDPEQILEQVEIPVRQYRAARPEALVEDIAFQKTFATINKFMNEKRNEPMTLYTEDPRNWGLKKRQRLMRVAHLFREGRVFFDKSDPTQFAMSDELAMFGSDDHDDLADAISCSLNKLLDFIEENWTSDMGMGGKTSFSSSRRDPLTGGLVHAIRR